MQQRIRITGLTFEDPAQLLANPQNWRIHPREQQNALHEVLEDVGWVGAVLQNDVTQHMLDGHARVEDAISSGQDVVPVLHCELELEEEERVLATYDAIGTMAGRDVERLDALIYRVGNGSGEHVQKLLSTMSGVQHWPQLQSPREDGTDATPGPGAGRGQRGRWALSFNRMGTNELREGLRHLHNELGESVDLTWVED